MAIDENDGVPGTSYQRARRAVPWLALGVAGAWVIGGAWAAVKLRGAPP